MQSLWKLIMMYMPSKYCPFFIAHSCGTQLILLLVEGTHVESRTDP